MCNNPFRGLFLLFSAFMLSLLAAPPASAADIVRTTLQNGLRVVIVRNTLAPAAGSFLSWYARPGIGGRPTARGVTCCAAA